MTYTDEDVIRAVDKFAPYLFSKFKINNFDQEDIVQEAYKKAFEVIQKGGYDQKRRLDDYIFMAIQNHFKNMMRRDRVGPSAAVCQNCSGEDCRECYAARQKRSYKQSIRNPSCLHEVDDEGEGGVRTEDNVLDLLGQNELFQTLHSLLNGEVRSNFIKIACGISVKHDARRAVQVAVAQVLTSRDFGIDYIDIYSFLGADDDEEEQDQGQA